jgi:tRNA threonylcarbamoyladenosine biosynthesis protein TsaB
MVAADPGGSLTRVLAVDTATEACSVALWVNGDVHRRHTVVGRTHTTVLLPMVQAVLAEAGVRPAQLDALVCGVGPGSFAGVRIGVGLVKGMALALNRPVVGVGSLAMLAQQALEAGHEAVCAAIDARMGEVYAGWYRAAQGLARPVAPDLVTDPAALTAPPGRWFGVGSGFAGHGTELGRTLGTALSGSDPDALPDAVHALRLGLALLRAGAGQDAAALEPAYLRNRVALTLAEQGRA